LCFLRYLPLEASVIRRSVMARKYTPFLEGELIDLCVPSTEAIADGWADWFNDAGTTDYLPAGVYPNTKEQQEEFYLALGGSRLALMVCDKAGEQLWGTISLSTIDWVARSAQISMVLPPSEKRPRNAALEAMARLGEHAFMTMGLERIWAGQAYPGLAKWNQRLELLGYRTEGLLRRGVTKGRRVSDSLMISVLYEDYERIVADRPYWPGATEVERLITQLPNVSLGERVARAVQREQDAYLAELGSRAGAAP